MHQITKTPLVENPSVSKKTMGPTYHILNLVKITLSFVFWAYIITKLFIYDIDLFLMKEFFPDYVGLLNYKFVIIIGLIALIWITARRKFVISWSLFLIFYPAILFFWKIPVFIFKQRSWILAFALINSIISFFQSFKYMFITTSFYIVSFTIIFVFSNKPLLWLASIIVFGLLLLTYIQRFLSIFKSSSVFQVHLKIIKNIRTRGVSSLALDEGIRNIPLEQLGEKQIEKWTTNLQTAVLFNRIVLFVAKKLRDYQNSKFNVLYYVLTILMLILVTAFSFALINYAQFKIDNQIFSFSKNPSFFTFFYYSFNNLLFNQIPELSPIFIISQTLSMIESFLALFLVAIFVSLFFSLRSEKHASELNEVISELEKYGSETEGLIREEYKINSIEDAVLELEKLKSSFAKLIFAISENIK